MFKSKIVMSAKVLLSISLVFVLAKIIASLLISGTPAPLIAIAILGLFGLGMYTWEVIESKIESVK